MLKALPEAGGLLDQDPAIMEAFAIIAREVAEHEEREAKKRGKGKG